MKAIARGRVVPWITRSGMAGAIGHQFLGIIEHI